MRDGEVTDLVRQSGGELRRLRRLCPVLGNTSADADVSIRIPPGAADPRLGPH